MIVKDILKRSLIYTNSFLGYVDHIFSVNTIENPPPPLFIVGVPRSGTTLTYQIVTQQLEVAYFTVAMGFLYGIPNITNRLMRPLLGRPTPVFKSHYGNTKGLLSPSEHANYWFQWFPYNDKMGHYVKPDKINLEDYESLQRSIESITSILQKPMVFKCLYLDMVVGVLAQIFPKAKFLFVRRDHIMNCQSLLSGRLQQKKPAEWWSVKPPGYKNLMSLPIWQQITNQVFLTENIIARDLKKYATGRYFEIHYEEICQTPQQIVKDIIEWVNHDKYKAYQDTKIPRRFTVSKRKSLSNFMSTQIKEYYDLLEKQGLS